MTKATIASLKPAPAWPRLCRAWWAAPWCCLLLSGCVSLQDSGLFSTKAAGQHAASADKPALVLQEDKASSELGTALQLFQEQKYQQAEPIFHRIADIGDGGIFGLGLFNERIFSRSSLKDRRAQAIVENALFHEAECQRLEKRFRDAEGTYARLLKHFPHSQFTDRVNQGLFEIAHHWLGETRRQMDEYHEVSEGKRFMVMPASFVHFSGDLPFTGAETQALRVLDTIRMHDINGPLGEKSLYYLATVNFFRRSYKDADFYYTQLYTQYPNGENAGKAVKQSIICKQMVNGGVDYDARPVEESKRLLLTAQGAYSELAQDGQWVQKQLEAVNAHRAQADFNVAELYRRMGKPGAAYFSYELVRRRYPNTDFAKKATERIREIHPRVESEFQEALQREGRGPLIQPPAPADLQMPQAPRNLPAGLDPNSRSR